MPIAMTIEPVVMVTLLPVALQVTMIATVAVMRASATTKIPSAVTVMLTP